MPDSSPIMEIAALVLDIDETKARTATRLNCSEWDSLKHIELMFAIEDAVSFKFTKEELESLDSVEAIMKVVESRD